MSQIGYMVMARLARSPTSPGLFHLMTHAFFKALLFMAAGSVIAAMAGEQNLDKMGGFRRGDAVHVRLHGRRRRWRSSGVPPFSGFFSKDEILAYVAARDDWHVVLAVLGYVGSFLTADLHVPDDLPRVLRRARRAGARARGRPPLPRARAHEPGDGRGRGHRRRLPRPGPPHRRARVAHEGRDGRARGRRDRRSASCRSRRSRTSLDTFLEPAFDDSRYFEALEPSDDDDLRRPR